MAPPDSERPPVESLDLWLLEAAMELPTPLHMLVEPNPHVALNMADDPRLSREELCERLSLLAERGLIRVHMLPDGLQALFSPEAISSAMDARQSRTPFGYSLTDAGGAAWEHHARPDWSRFVNAGQEPSADDAQDAWVIEAASLEAAEGEFHFHESLGDVHQPVSASKRGEVLTPWQVTYWKALPHGYRLRYVTVPRPPDPARSRSVPSRLPWYTRVWL
ncbi:hypothetical protein [Myxococcus sp. AM010]|uniref:hypothetical protein n=1 Tax=Myxococcus sp. AM010 TaxID=2745138 RepID=UPI001C3D68C2|nr:hypothetical protein [Myxococcus sp. AM010]